MRADAAYDAVKLLNEELKKEGSDVTVVVEANYENPSWGDYKRNSPWRRMQERVRILSFPGMRISLFGQMLNILCRLRTMSVMLKTFSGV